MKAQRFTALLEKRNIKIHQPLEWDIFLQKFDGKEIQLDVKEAKKRKQRTIDQNNMYWAVVEEIAKHEGNDIMDQHQFFLENFFSNPIIKKYKNGKEYKMPRADVSSTDCDTKEFSQVMERILKYANHPDYLGMDIRNPNDPPVHKFTK